MSVHVFGLLGFLAERMAVDELLGLGVETLDVLLQLRGFDPPLAAAADLHGRDVATTNQRVDLVGRDVEHLGDVGELEEARSWHACWRPFESTTAGSFSLARFASARSSLSPTRPATTNLW